MNSRHRYLYAILVLILAAILLANIKEVTSYLMSLPIRDLTPEELRVWSSEFWNQRL